MRLSKNQKGIVIRKFLKMFFKRQKEKDFPESWDEIDLYFKGLCKTEDYSFTTSLLDLIADLRGKGFDKLFRAGKSMWILFLSRSLEYGLRDDQHSIGIEPTKNGTFKVFYSDGKTISGRFETSELKGSKEFELLLNSLAKQPIN